MAKATGTMGNSPQVHEAVQGIKQAAEAGKGVVDSGVAVLEAFCDKIDELFGADPQAVPQLVEAVRDKKHEIAKAIES